MRDDAMRQAVEGIVAEFVKLELAARTPYEKAKSDIRQELCDAGLCINRLAAERVGYVNDLVHTTVDGQVHRFGRTAAPNIELANGCCSVKVDGTRPSVGEQAKCPVCPAGEGIDPETVEIRRAL